MTQMSPFFPVRFVDEYAIHVPLRVNGPPWLRDLPSVRSVTLPVLSSRRYSWNHSPPPTSFEKTMSAVFGR